MLTWPFELENISQLLFGVIVLSCMHLIVLSLEFVKLQYSIQYIVTFVFGIKGCRTCFVRVLLLEILGNLNL